MTHTVLWIDHREARLFGVEGGKFDESSVGAPHRHFQSHQKRSGAEHDHLEDRPRFYGEVAHALEGVAQILVVGPGTAKLEFLRYLHEKARGVEANVVGIETVDHPTDGQLIAFAKRYFGIPERQR